MKRILPVILFFLFVQKAIPNYTFTKLTGTYANLSAPVSINNGVVWSSFQSFIVPVGFSFNFFGNNYSTIYMEGSGFTRFDANYFYLINPYTVALKDMGSGSSQSPLSYKTEGMAPNRILKIEWNNCGFVNDAGSTVNFQLWLYETSNIIEIHIGPSSINNPANAFSGNSNDGPVVALFNLASNPNLGYYVQGAPPAESMGTQSGSITNIFAYSMSGVPVNGTIYRFEPAVSAVTENENPDEPDIFPNPAKHQVSIRSPLITSSSKITLTGLNGISFIIENNGSGIFFLPEITPGIYFLQVESGKAIFRKKLVIVQ